ncbi:unnamed protein product, partial [Allacma fusca]
MSDSEPFLNSHFRAAYMFFHEVSDYKLENKLIWERIIEECNLNKILHFSFFFYRNENLTRILKTYTVIEKGYSDKLSPVDVWKHLFVINPRKFNYEGNGMEALVCAVCDKHLIEYERTGKFTHVVVAKIFEFSKYINSSLRLIPIRFLPQESNIKDGDWDDFIKPLLNGSAAISTIIRLAPGHLPILYETMYSSEEGVRFVTGTPQRILHNSIYRLTSPFSLSVWISSLWCIVTVFLTLEIIIRYQIDHFQCLSRKFRQGEKYRRHHSSNTLIAILQPIVDQNALSSITFSKSIKNNFGRVLIGMWFLLLISLGCVYKSKLIQMVVMPRYHQPPSTFR